MGEIDVTIKNVAVNATAGKVCTTQQGGVLTLMPAARPEDPISFGLCLIFRFNIWLLS